MAFENECPLDLVVAGEAAFSLPKIWGREKVYHI